MLRRFNLNQMASKPFGSSNKKEDTIGILFLVVCIIKRDSNPERVLREEKQSGGLLFSKSCEVRYRNARHLGGRAGKTRSDCVPEDPP